MKKVSITDLSADQLRGKRVFVRVDFNVPLKDGQISDDMRILAALPTVTYLISCGAKIILASHLGRPDGEVKAKLRLDPVAQRLSTLLGKPVVKTLDCIGEEVSNTVSTMRDGDVVLLENVRFHKGEETNAPEFVAALAKNADIFVQEAFGTAHRSHASTVGVGQRLPAYAGILVQKEIDFLHGAVHDPKRPFVAIVGGAKVSSKITVLKNLLKVADEVIIGGGMTFTFLKAQGYEIGTSLCEDDQIKAALSFLTEAKASGKKVHFAIDEVVTSEFPKNDTQADDLEVQVVTCSLMPKGWMGVDIGPQTITLFQEVIASARTVLWNGPMGVFERARFAQGTHAIGDALVALTEKGGIAIVGGGDSAAALEQMGLADKVSHVSTGGGASLEFLENPNLPGIRILQDR